VATVVTNDVLFHEPARRILQDVVTCIRHNVTIDEAGFRRERHADRYLKPPEEMAWLFSRYPEAVARAMEIAVRCTFSMDEIAYQYPEERTLPGLTPQQALEKLTWEGAARKRLDRAVEDGELSSDVSTADLAKFYTVVIQGLALQAQHGGARKDLLRVVAVAMDRWPSKDRA
jgi:DNA polymerase III alpha subunit